MPSFALDLYGPTSCLVAGEVILGDDRQWNTTNGFQASFLELAFGSGRQDVREIPEIKSKVSWDHDELNAWMKAEGFDLEFEPFDANTFGMVSIFELLAKWLNSGEPEQMFVDHRVYDAVDLTAGVSFMEAPGHNGLVVCIETQSGHHVFMMMADQPEDEMSMFKQIMLIRAGLTSSEQGFAGVRFPMVDMNIKPDISKLKKMWTLTDDGRRGKIVQALQQVVMQISTEGFYAKTCTAMACGLESCFSGPPIYEINSSFLVWVEAPTQLSLPLVMAYVTPEHWNDPGRLGVDSVDGDDQGDVGQFDPAGGSGGYDWSFDEGLE